jgi:hypothetical protein
MNKYYCIICGQETKQNIIACQNCYEETEKQEQNDEWLKQQFKETEKEWYKKIDELIEGEKCYLKKKDKKK